MKNGISGRLLRVLLAGLVSAGATPIAAQTAEELIESGHVRIRHRLEPSEPVYVGQPVRVWVDVMTRTWFLEAPRYPSTIEVQNAIVIPPEAFAVNSSERIGGETFAVQGRAFTVFPQTTGRFEVPPIPVELIVAREDASRSPVLTLATEPLTIKARLPAGAAGHGLVLSAPELNVREAYDRGLEGLRVGDSFKRQVTMTIEDSVAMLLPPITFEASEGFAVYLGRPDITDRRNRGRMSGTRRDEATYVLEKEGTYQLPGTTIWWWNLRTSTLEQEILPGVEFTVEANPELAAEHLGQLQEEVELAEEAIDTGESDWGFKQWALVIAILALGILVLRRAGEWARSDRERQARQGESEEVFFRRFEDAARSNDPAATHRALMSWLDRFEPLAPPASGRQFVVKADDEELAREYSALEGELFGPSRPAGSGGWSGRSLAAAASRARQRLRGWQKGSQPRAGGLPALNP